VIGMGTLIALLFVIGFLVLGPKRMQEVMRQLGKVKGQLNQSSRDLKIRVAAEMEDLNIPK
jgi:Sec-independent protein translocase protein TatA